MNNKQAVIVEIYRQYCIVLTEDGQFLKQAIPAGIYEIGDSITVFSEQETENVKFDIYRIISRAAAGFAICAVVAFGIYFTIHFLRPGSSTMTVAVQDSITEETMQAPLEETEGGNEMQAEDETAILDKEAGEAKLMQERSIEAVENNLSEDAPEDKDLAEISTATPVLYEGMHSLVDTDKVILIDYEDIRIDYSVEESGISSGGSEAEKSLLLNFMQNKKDYFFNGNIDTVLNDTNSSAIKTVSMLFENFEYGQERTEEVVLENDEKSFTLVIYGSFN